MTQSAADVSFTFLLFPTVSLCIGCAYILLLSILFVGEMSASVFRQVPGGEKKKLTEPSDRPKSTLSFNDSCTGFRGCHYQLTSLTSVTAGEEQKVD